MGVEREGPAMREGTTFLTFAAKHGLSGPMPEFDTSLFRPPRSASGQLR